MGVNSLDTQIVPYYCVKFNRNSAIIRIILMFTVKSYPLGGYVLA